MYIYLDESGDLGFSEGSSKYFVIAFVRLNKPEGLKRCVRKIKQKYNIPSNVELKGYETQLKIKKELLIRFSRLPDLEIYSITAKKENIEERLRTDTNIFYNYMTGLSLIEKVLKEPKGSEIIINIDKRIISITSGFNLEEYIKYKIWYEGGRLDLDLKIHYIDSHNSLAIQGIDIITNAIFKKHEWGNDDLAKIIWDKVKMDKRLFFNK